MMIQYSTQVNISEIIIHCHIELGWTKYISTDHKVQMEDIICP